MTANSAREPMKEIGIDFEHHLEEFRKEVQSGMQFFYAMLAISAVASENQRVLERLSDASLFWNTNIAHCRPLFLLRLAEFSTKNPLTT